MTRSVAPPKSNNYNVDFSKQFLVFGIGFVITLFELALAQWSFLFSSAPMISLCYFYILGLLRPKLLSFITVISLALLFELMGGDMLGVRVTAFYVVALMLKKRIVQSENNDFIAHWANFSLVCLAVVIFRLLMFMMIYFTPAKFICDSVSDRYFNIGFPNLLCCHKCYLKFDWFPNS